MASDSEWKMEEPHDSSLNGFCTPMMLTVCDAKQCLVKEEGMCVDIAPTFWALRKSDWAQAMGQCNQPVQRMVIATPFGGTRWMALTRQVVKLTGADLACAACEILVPHPMDPEQEMEAIEITVMDAEDAWTIIRPYTYQPPREIIWWPPVDPDPNFLVRATAMEIDSFRRAMLPETFANPVSVKYLSGICETHWSGHPDMVSKLLSVN